MTVFATGMASISVNGDDICQAPEQTGDSPLPQPAIFHLFPNLPPEVRHQIWSWNVTLSEPQVHFLSQGNAFGGNPANNTPHIGSPPLPVALMINKESRSIALEHYKLFPRYPPDSYSPEQMPHGYCDPRKDILHIPNMLRNHDWNFANIPFREITICMQKGDNPGGPLQFPDTHMQELTSNLPMELIKMSKQRLALGLVQPGESFAPSITSVNKDDSSDGDSIKNTERKLGIRGPCSKTRAYAVHDERVDDDNQSDKQTLGPEFRQSHQNDRETTDNGIMVTYEVTTSRRDKKSSHY
ncbi:hypothetical protein HYE68_004045 [Fusarium pseudograminearum]|nr:hypothetical protein HYE68_004045 [Fusarium pseudograminearum]